MTMYKVDGNDLTSIANAIRTKTGEVSTMTIADMPTEIGSISGCGNVLTKTLTPNFNNGDVTITPETGQIGFSSVTIQKDSNLIASNIKKDIVIHGITGSYETSIEFLFENADLISDTYIDKNNGNLIGYGGWSSTDFIEVVPNEVITFAASARDVYNAFYDSSKAFISNFRLNNTGYGHLTIPNNVYYIRLSDTTNNMQCTRMWRD